METPERASSSASPNQSPIRASPSPLPPSSDTRLWRPKAARNLRNQWEKLEISRSQWVSSSSDGRSHATSLVKAYVSLKSIDSMQLGVLNDMPDIRKKAHAKLFKQQEVYRSKLLSSYKAMVKTVGDMVTASKSMRCYVQGSSSLLQFSISSDDSNDPGDGGGIPVFMFLPISSHEQLAEELVQMFIFELNLKRLLVMELLAIDSEVQGNSELCWSNALYPTEFDELSLCSLYSKETCELVPPSLIEGKSNKPSMKFKSDLKSDTLEVCLTTWRAEVNIDSQRVDEIFAIAREEWAR
ncbi:hypothetical protein Tsubulata_009063 [Turnera subulata]|uniref:Uncharacterized protein n=1 Tax=Turnera subulata TaxID=218843 RepID=A0A9Q0JH33_9ROSI|nr:hypothetical protein Tsubulata_009063 [Turnera subulata]